MINSGAKRYQWLELFRGLAAVWVVLHHSDLALAAFHPDLPGRSNIISNGLLGVDFFFVLSGFIIAYSASRVRGTKHAFRRYALSRLVRIYLPYLPIGIGLVLAYHLLPELSQGNRDFGILTSITLLPSAKPPALSVAWTLIHELIFYAVFSLLFFSIKILFFVGLFWVFMILVAEYSMSQVGLPGSYFLSPLNLNFALGVFVFYLATLIRTRISIFSVLFMAGLGVALILFAASKADPIRMIASIGFGFLILAAAMDGADKGRLFGFAIVLGSASYSIYLIHLPVLSVFVRIWPDGGLLFIDSETFWLISLISVLFGVAYYYLYEKQALYFGRRLVSSWLEK